MRRGWLLLFLLSIGLNIGLGYAVITHRSQPVRQGREFFDRRGQRQGPGRGVNGQEARFMERRLNRLERHLRLDEAQAEEFRRAQDAMRPQISQYRHAVRQARMHLQDACLAPDTPADSVRQKVQALAIAQGKLDSVVTETLLQELAILDPAQRQRYLATLPWDRSADSIPTPDIPRHGRRRER